MTPKVWAPPSPEQIESNIRLLCDLLGAHVVAPYVEIGITPAQVELLHRLGLREPPDVHVRKCPVLSVVSPAEAEALLLAATVPGGPLEQGFT